MPPHPLEENPQSARAQAHPYPTYLTRSLNNNKPSLYNGCLTLGPYLSVRERKKLETDMGQRDKDGNG